MLSDLVDHACGDKGRAGLNLGRDSKAAWVLIRGGAAASTRLGNSSAHARRYLAKPVDLAKHQTGDRVLVQELLHIAELV